MTRFVCEVAVNGTVTGACVSVLVMTCAFLPGCACSPYIRPWQICFVRFLWNLSGTFSNAGEFLRRRSPWQPRVKAPQPPAGPALETSAYFTPRCGTKHTTCCWRSMCRWHRPAPSAFVLLSLIPTPWLSIGKQVKQSLQLRWA